ncbi:MAG: hypothetical protein EWM72_02892 [Nitrospira sp.]|nr:MAG: hypothetical protein EWM72_02892 [Nitrospira sp.]
MLYSLLADLVLLLHLAYVLFVLFGGLLVLKWRRAAWLHLPAVAWGAFVEFSGWICPLTPLENWLRARGGGQGYEGDFLEYYLLALLYPDGLTRATQTVLGAIVISLNLAVYGWLWRVWQRP